MLSCVVTQVSVLVDLYVGCWSCTYSGYGVLNLHSSLELVNLKASLLLMCFISLDTGCGLMKG